MIDRALAPRRRRLRIGLKSFNGDVTVRNADPCRGGNNRPKFGPHPDVLCNNLRVAESRDGSRADGTPNGTAWRSGGAMSS